MKNMREKLIQKEWDETYKELTLEELPWETKEPDEILVDLIKSGKVIKGNALDICCGAGTQSIYLSRKRFNVVGIDISPTAIKTAKRRSKIHAVKANFVIGNSFQLPFKERIFDFIFDRGCFHHVPPRERLEYVSGVNRVLRNNGKMHITAFCYKNGPAPNCFTKQEIIDYFSNYFDIQNIEEATFTERMSGIKRYFYTVFIIKK